MSRKGRRRRVAIDEHNLEMIMVLKASLTAALGTACALLVATPVLAGEPASTDQVEAPEPAMPQPALWTLRDEDTVVHLFGYASALPPGAAWRSPGFDDLLAHADIVVLESNSTDPAAASEVQSTVRSLGIIADGTTLSQKLGEAQAEELAAIAAGLGLPIAALDRLRPWLAAVQLGVVAAQRQGDDLANTPATVIASEAAANGTELVALEGPTDLMRRMASLPDDEQVSFLMHAARTIRDDPDQSARTNAAWLAGDVASLAGIFHGDGAWSSKAVYDLMLVSRNVAWRQQIETLLESRTGSILVTIGAGHLAGPDSLVTMLTAAGWDVEREAP
ncbi:TraB/GumN family protein [Erythrobacter mangrovi]|uniref:TraB/GumN family protein n=1 Tax=Erythrobacter mangrovi TaxID=2739433 RepID=A0A7D4BBC9_9SPHN|nr:TraB/GumN family protein [Erythrobacter mangrovi]QKG71766.1 TraB/GumN family protein [Erythrobacter mangrovi]